jgi:hypothetical protein
MRTFIIATCLLALTIPIAAQARSGCEARAQDRRVAGTVLGAVGGAIIGNQVSHHGGALIGGLGGAVVGNQLARTKCYHRSAYAEGRDYRRDGREGPNGYAPEAGAPPSSGRCSYEDQPFYDANGALIHRQVQVCR